MYIPFNLLTEAKTLTGENVTISSLYTDILGCLPQIHQLYDREWGLTTVDVIIDCIVVGGEDIEEIITDYLKELKEWGFVKCSDEGYWYLTDRGYLLNQELQPSRLMYGVKE